jgi:tetratricopeptide (TPR) repeat protein
MNARTALLLAGALTAAAAWCQSKPEADSLVAQGQRLYLAGDHRGALDALLKAEEGFDAPALQLAIGNAWYKTGDIPRAILHYERGLRLAPGDPDLLANRDLAASQVKDRLPGDPDHALARIWREVKAGSDPDQWARRALWLMALLCAAIALARLTGRRAIRRTAYALTGLLGGLLLASTGFAAARKRALEAHGAAIIMAPRMDARAEPREGAKTLFILHKGAKVEVRDTTNGWTEVRLPNGSVGWMPPGSLELV